MPGTQTLTDVTCCHSSPSMRAVHLSDKVPRFCVICPSPGSLACMCPSGLVVSVIRCLVRKARRRHTSPALRGQRWRPPVTPWCGCTCPWGCRVAPLCQLHPPVIHPEADIMKAPLLFRSLDFWSSLRLTWAASRFFLVSLLSGPRSRGRGILNTQGSPRYLSAHAQHLRR